MSLSMMKEAIRITDQFCGLRETESIERQGRLQNSILLVFIFHMMMVVAFIKLQEFEVAYPRIIKDVDVSFEFTPPPAQPPPKAMELPRAISLTAGENPNPGAEAAPNPLNVPDATMPALKAPETQEMPTIVAAKPVPSRKTTVAPPVAITPTNIVKSDVRQIVPKQAPVPPPTGALAGAASNQQLSGAPTQGGAPWAAEGGLGPGGAGEGGTGTGKGDVGAGAGQGQEGGIAITPRLPTLTPLINISPYRKDLLVRLAQNWHPTRTLKQALIVLLTVDHDGHLVSCEILQSSGNRKTDKEALKAVHATEFAPLPDAYKGDTLPFKIELNKLDVR